MDLVKSESEGARVAHRLGGEHWRRPCSGGVEGGDDQRVGHAAPALASASTKGHHGGRRWGGRGRGRVRIHDVVGGWGGLDDVCEWEPGGAVDGEAVGLTAGARRHHRRGREYGGRRWAVVAGDAVRDCACAEVEVTTGKRYGEGGTEGIRL